MPGVSGNRRAFFATMPGVITGVAGILTAVVGLLTVSVQLGWLGSKDSGNGTTATTRPAPGASTTTTVPVQFTTQPSRVVFDVLGPREGLVTVRNTSPTVAITWRAFTIGGVDRSAFSASDVTCGTRLDPNRSCDVKVRFVPPHSGDFIATLVLQPEGAAAREVELVGKALL
jgi:hypothetical protein